MKIPGLRFWRPHAVFGALGIVLSLAVNGQEPQRSWSNGKGQSISAQLSDIDVDKGTVSLVRADGAPFVLPIASLSIQDQGYIESILPRYRWTSVSPIDLAAPSYAAVLQALKIGDTLTVRVVRNDGASSLQLRQGKPIGYRERLFFEYAKEVPRVFAIDDEGNLLFVETSSHSLCHVKRGMALSVVHQSVPLQPIKADSPALDTDSRLAAVPGGGFLLWAKSLSEVTKQGDSKRTFMERGSLYNVRLNGAAVAFNRIVSSTLLPLESGMQTLEAFGGRRVITRSGWTRDKNRLELHDLPKASNLDGDTYSAAETSWELPLGPLQVVFKSQVIVAGYSGQTGMPFLLDFENQTFSPIGQPATPEVDGSAHIWQPAISPRGTYLVHYNRAKGAFMQLDLGRSSD
jgi:hypothetical protein